MACCLVNQRDFFSFQAARSQGCNAIHHVHCQKASCTLVSKGSSVRQFLCTKPVFSRALRGKGKQCQKLWQKLLPGLRLMIYLPTDGNFKKTWHQPSEGTFRLPDTIFILHLHVGTKEHAVDRCCYAEVVCLKVYTSSVLKMHTWTTKNLQKTKLRTKKKPKNHNPWSQQSKLRECSPGALSWIYSTSAEV